MRKWTGLLALICLLGMSFGSSSCAKNGCPAEIQYKKKKKKKSLSKSSKTNLWSKKMRKRVRDPKF